MATCTVRLHFLALVCCLLGIGRSTVPYHQIDLTNPRHTCRMSSQYSENYVQSDCHAAINGNTSNTYMLTSGKQNCIHTANGDRTPWWWVDMGKEYTVYWIRIFVRDGQRVRMSHLQVYIDQTRVLDYGDKVPPKNSAFIDIHNGTLPCTGRYLNISRHATSDYFLNICEVQVWACPSGSYGQNCAEQCGGGCQQNTCNNVDGTCECQTGWQSPMCTGCADGYYGPSCQKCGAGCVGGTCGPGGHCNCKPGYQSDKCDQVCPSGSYGRYCREQCGDGCQHDTCNNVNGTCTCRTGWDNPMCKGCSSAYYGPFCQKCGAGCVGGTCNQNGHCRCTPGWQPRTCSLGCSSAWYGQNCTTPCGTGCQGNTCNAVNGECTCKPGWSGPMCTTCAVGYYGPSCQKCGAGCLGDKCAPDGHCTCHPGWQPGNCTKRCLSGHYGQNCTVACGAGCQGNTCDPEHGNCTCNSTKWKTGLCAECSSGNWGNYLPGATTPATCTPCGSGCSNTCDVKTGNCTCRPGWQPPKCDRECPHGKYGDGCNSTCGVGCQGNNCDDATGVCTCGDGWSKPLCDGCAAGYYGPSSDCTSTCSVGCLDTTSCAPDDGSCSCQRGWTGSTCDACNSSSWGSTNCSLPCGHCAGDGSCDIVSGNCTHGCSNGFDGSACFLKLESEDVSVGGVVGGVAAVIIVIAIAIVVGVIIFRRRRYMKDREPADTDGDHSVSRSKRKDASGDKLYMSSLPEQDAQRTTPTSKDKPTVPVKPMKRGGADSEEQAGHTYGNTSASAEHVYSNVPAPSNGQSISKTVRPPVAAPRPSAKPSRGNVYENVQLSGAARQRPEPPPKPAAVSRVSSGAGQKADEYEEEEDVYNTEDLYACYNTVSTKPQLDALQKYLLEALASGELSAQFGEFAKGMTLPHKDGMSEENVRKNRFKAMCAYDFNRVHLHRPKGDPDTDYINASYIKGCRGDKQYIATQGPRDTHVNDLWWMVWQEKATQVVMLTNLIEDGKDKCEEYWPAAGKTQTYGHVTVRGLEVEERADFVIRPFTLKVKGAGERQVTQYHFNTWPDHGVPQAPALVDFWRYVKARGNPRVPLIVHCSAGVGRTGTFIALDIASELEAGGKEVNVQQIVIELREQRCIMVQSEAQYKFLHEVILEAHTSRDTRIPVDKFEETFPSHISVNHHNHRIDREFKMLEEMGKYRPKRSYRMANMKENVDKNRNQDAVPDDDHVVYLNVHVRGRNQYINAVYMSSLRKRQGLVLTQLPIPNKTLVDFWRMVDGCHVNTIVSIGSQNEEETVENYCRFWPPADTKSITTGPYVITLVSLNVLSDHLSSYSLRLTQKGENKVGEVQLLHYKDWAGELPDDMSSLIQLVDTVKAEDDASSPIVIQCIDGATKSGLFCAIYDIINRLMYDDEIDVYMTARYVQSIRPQAVSTEAQYRFLYKVAQEYISHLSVYQNTNVRA